MKLVVLVFIVGCCVGLNDGLNSVMFTFMEMLSIFLFYAWPFVATKGAI